MKTWIWPLLALAVVVIWGFWPFQRASGEEAPRPRAWSGWVTDAASRPIRAALVVLDPTPEGSGAALVVETDRDGRFHWPDPPRGRHRVLVGQINYLPLLVEDLTVDPAAPPRAFVLRQTERVVEGQVRGGSGEAIAWARVEYPAEVFAPEEMKPVRTRLAVRTDAKGRFRIARGLRADAPCTLEVERTGFAPVEVVVDLSVGDPPPQDVRLQPLSPAVLDGLVVGPDGLAAPGAHVEVRSEEQVRCDLTDDEGRFALGGLREGRVTLLLRPSEIGLRAGFAPARRPDVSVPGTIRVDLEWVPPNERPGAVALSFEVPPATDPIEAVWIRDEAHPFEELRIQGGRCTAYQGGLAPGPLQVFVRAGEWVVAQVVEVPAGETLRLAPTPHRGRSLRLRVRDGAGGPPVMGAIALPYVDAPGRVAFELSPKASDDRGEVLLRGLPEDCRIEVSAPGREPREVRPDRAEQDVPLEPRR